MIDVVIVTWDDARTELLSVRKDVFVREQGVPESMEEDEHDEASQHFLARDKEGNAIGTARLLPSGQIGRVAVLNSMRRRGIGSLLMEKVIHTWEKDSSIAEDSKSRLSLHAQVSSMQFYESLGFVATGPVFEEAGIPHRIMCYQPETLGATP